MAKKEDKAIEYFKEVMLERYGATSFIYENGIMYSLLNNNVSILTVPEKVLWDMIIEDETLKPIMEELDPTNKTVKEMMTYVDDIEGSSWFGIDSDAMYANKVVEIPVYEFGYSVPISRGLFPKMKKVEYGYFSYRIFMQPKPVIALKKKWKAPGCSFTCIRPFLLI